MISDQAQIWLCFTAAILCVRIIFLEIRIDKLEAEYGRGEQSIPAINQIEKTEGPAKL